MDSLLKRQSCEDESSVNDVIKASSAAAADDTAATSSEENVDNSGNTIFVVKMHYHEDDYKCADSNSRVMGAFDDELAALKKCIVKNISKNSGDDFKIETLLKILTEKFPDRVNVKQKYRCGPLGIFTEEEILEVLETLNYEQLRAIHLKIRMKQDKTRGEFTQKPSAYVYSYHDVILNKEHPENEFDEDAANEVDFKMYKF